ncbi:MAG: hypothetical protein M1833_000994 [Piccolia ochrophora]|nr:MAG: hypothetical protein M1833_000994 [Piccolia ochrophora]
MSEKLQEQGDTEPGAAIYSRWLLAIYDLWVLGFVNSFIWRCSTKRTLLPFFRKNVRKHHLDIGVGTGYYLKHANIPADVNVTLADLNANTLVAAKEQLGRPDAETWLHDITKPLPTKDKFDSISMFYLLHCMPPPTSSKTAIFSHLKFNMASDGVLYGATILGEGVKHNLMGKALKAMLNRKGVFGNTHDTEAEFVDALKENFNIVHSQVVGAILLFKAEEPKLKV